MPTCVKLTELTTAPGSAQRFDQLCAAMGDGIVGSVWFYSTSEPDALQASLDTLPIILKALGVGAARYLKVRCRTFRKSVSVQHQNNACS